MGVLRAGSEPQDTLNHASKRTYVTGRVNMESIALPWWICSCSGYDMASTSPRRERECSSVHLCSRRLPAAIPVSCEDIDIVNDITQYLEFASDSPDFVTVLFCVYEVAGLRALLMLLCTHKSASTEWHSRFVSDDRWDVSLSLSMHVLQQCVCVWLYKGVHRILQYMRDRYHFCRKQIPATTTLKCETA